MNIKNYNINSSLGLAIIIIIAILIGVAFWFFASDLNLQDNFGFSGNNNDAVNNTEQEDEEDFQVSDSGNIIVFNPDPNEEIGLPLEVRGEARVFENTVNMRLLDNDGTILREAFAIADSPDVGEFGVFAFSVNYPEPSGSTGTVEVFSQSARDGSDINMVRIPVIFKNVESTTVRVYFTTENKITTGTCQAEDYVERRVPSTQAVGRASINELLQGPTQQEFQAGFRTSINSGTSLQSLRIENNTAYADFNSVLDAGVAGSCNVQAIRSQIENTLKQFSTVSDVVISINGETDVILQP